MLPFATNGFGFGSAQLAVPNEQGLLGGVFHAQAFVIDPQSPVLGITFSAGRSFVVGED